MAIAPDLFETDEYGFAQAVDDGEVSASREEDAILAIKNCPEQAIEVVGE